MLAAVLAFAALVAVRAGWRVAPALVWLFTVEGLADFINAIAQGLRFGIPMYHLGVVWLLLTYAVPAFIVAQVLVIAVLLYHARRRTGDVGNVGNVGNVGEPAETVPDRLTAGIS